jgi:hypothetical protein
MYLPIAFGQSRKLSGKLAPAAGCWRSRRVSVPAAVAVRDNTAARPRRDLPEPLRKPGRRLGLRDHAVLPERRSAGTERPVSAAARKLRTQHDPLLPAEWCVFGRQHLLRCRDDAAKQRWLRHHRVDLPWRRSGALLSKQRGAELLHQSAVVLSARRNRARWRQVREAAAAAVL